MNCEIYTREARENTSQRDCEKTCNLDSFIVNWCDTRGRRQLPNLVIPCVLYFSALLSVCSCNFGDSGFQDPEGVFVAGIKRVVYFLITGIRAAGCGKFLFRIFVQ